MTQRKDAPDQARSAERGTGAKDARKESRKRLGDNLRKMYDEVVSEPVPKEMLDLLSRLSRESGQK
ncbi:MAG: hypothetical protein GC201_17435 [Alphaproteobacteria bacterium]|nr:hypothetical protein [Alphaproteobacteria bacterium]